MTISYQFNVATASFAGFPKLLARWKGSVYKLVFKEVLVYATLYILISCVYRIALDEPQRRCSICAIVVGHWELACLLVACLPAFV